MNKQENNKKNQYNEKNERSSLASFLSEVFKSRQFWVGIVIFSVVCIIGVGLFVWFVADSTEGDTAQEETEPEVIRHPLTGEVVEEDLQALPQVFGVMVENAADARPLSGLNEAFLVIEAPVEASISRMIAFFYEDQEVEKIGPVRSARPYYLDWNDELDAVYAHVGGSPQALDLIANTYETVDLNQFWYDRFFYRQTVGRSAPHNVFTTMTLLREALQQVFEDVDKPEYDVWRFTDGQAVEDPKSVSIDWTEGTLYDVRWEFDPQTNAYVRYQAGSVMNMSDGTQVRANNVAILATDIRVLDAQGRRSIVTVGEGDALIFQNGEMQMGRWSKPSREQRLRFFGSDGEEIVWNAGSTWVEVVSSLSQATTQE